MRESGQYDADILKKVQQAELEILRDFTDLCDKNGLTCFGVAGTGIGAIRHRGFIPWDDDIDVAMPRKDFDRFVEIAKRDYSDRYFVMNGAENPDYPLVTTRWMMNDTVFREWPLRNIKCPLGIFLDIYPLDNIPDDERLFRRQARITFFWSKLLILRSIAFPVLPFRGFLTKPVHAVCACIHGVLVLFRVSKKWLHRQCLKYSTMYNGTETKRVDFLCDTTAYVNIHELDGLYPLRKIRFEDVDLNFPGNIEQNLTRTFGDFMTPPPPEKRKNHMPYQLKFRGEEMIGQ